MPTQPNYVEQQWFKMKELYGLQNTDTRYIDFTRIFPRINYLQGNSHEEIRYWYDFGAVKLAVMDNRIQNREEACLLKGLL